MCLSFTFYLKGEKMKKLSVLIIVAILIAGCQPEVEQDTEYDMLVKFAERQAVEIAIIEQAARLQQLKMAIKKAKIRPIPVNSEIPKEVADVNKSSDL